MPLAVMALPTTRWPNTCRPLAMAMWQVVHSRPQALMQCLSVCGPAMCWVSEPPGYEFVVVHHPRPWTKVPPQPDFLQNWCPACRPKSGSSVRPNLFPLANQDAVATASSFGDSVVLTALTQPPSGPPGQASFAVVDESLDAN